MISVDGAGLIAQVMPVGLLIITVEQKWLGPAKREPGPIGTIWWYLALPFKAITLILCLSAMWACLAAVSNNQPLDGFSASVVVVALILLGMTVFATLLALLAYGHVGRDTALANIDHHDRKQLIIYRAQRVAKLNRRDEKRASRKVEPSQPVDS